MANPTFLFMNPASVVYTGSAGCSGFTNLNDYDDANTLDGTLNDSDYIQIDLGSSVPVTHAVIRPAYAEMEVAFTITITGSNSATFVSSTGLEGDIMPRLVTAYDSPRMFALTTTGSFRYIRLKWEGTISWLPSFRSIWFGEGLVMDSPFDVPARFENLEYKTFEGVSLNGNLRTSQAYTGGRVVNEVRWSIQSDSTAQNIRQFVQAVKGRRYPFYYCEDSAGTFADNPVRLMHFSDDYVPVETISYNRNSVSMKMRTHTSDI